MILILSCPSCRPSDEYYTSHHLSDYDTYLILSTCSDHSSCVDSTSYWMNSDSTATYIDYIYYYMG
jgi:hypothetical protein